MMEPLSFHVEATVLTDNRPHSACSEDCQLKACQKKPNEKLVNPKPENSTHVPEITFSDLLRWV